MDEAMDAQRTTGFRGAQMEDCCCSDCRWGYERGVKVAPVRPRGFFRQMLQFLLDRN